MSNIYKITNPETGESQLVVSKEYVDIRLNRLENAIMQHIKDSDKAHTLDAKLNTESPALLDKEQYTDIYIPKSTDPIKAQDIKTDAEHKFISQTQLEVFKNKASISEAQALINNSINEIKSQFNAMYINLLNKPDAVKKLKDLISLIDESETLDQIMASFSTKVSKEELDEHATNSVVHVNSVDRKALDILIGLIKDGTFDKIKAQSLDFVKAAENAINLDGMTSDEVRSRGKYVKIYGVDGYVDPFRVDVLFPGQQYLDNEIAKQNFINTSGKVLFAESFYNIDTFYLNRSNNMNDLTIEGCGSGTIINVKYLQANNVLFRDLTISGNDTENLRSAIISSNVIFENVTFDKVDITLSASKYCRFKNCIFKNCRFTMTGVCIGNIIKECIFIKTSTPKYIGGSNIISDNVIV